VRRAAVVAVPDARYGERPVAFLDWQGTPFPTVETLARRLEPSLPRHMQPDQIWPWPADLPTEWKVPLAWLRARALDLLARRA
jgi:acyl-CoA synthetase (AMP-forming)/AMP-acid ligase II